MSVTSTTSATPTAATTATAAAAKSAASIITTLGTGSGIDVSALAKGLVEAEQAPRQALIQAKITRAEATVSGFAAVKYALSTVQAAFADLKDLSDYNAFTTVNTQPSAFSVTPSSKAAAGSHTVSITSLAKPQRSVSDGFASTAVFNGGAEFYLKLSVNGGDAESITVSAGDNSPAGIVAVINDADLGVTAQLINTGDATSPYRIMVTGTSGEDNNFTLVSADANGAALADLDFGTLQVAADAALTVDGVAITSSTNQVVDAISGVTLNLYALTTDATSGQSSDAATVDLTRDTSVVKTKILALVKAYNDAEDLFTEVADPASTLETYGGTLARNSGLSYLRTQLRTMFTGDSSTASGSLSALRDIGIEITNTGQLSTNSIKLDLALNFSFDDTVQMLSGGQEDQGSFDDTSAGIAGDSFKAITTMLDSSSMMATESNNATTRIDDFKDEILKLQTRMDALLARYMKQFAVMDSLVGQSNSLRTSLTSTFEGMMATYTNK